jgi:N-acetylglutamate synthase-like GNAT family acetyltransferase
MAAVLKAAQNSALNVAIIDERDDVIAYGRVISDTTRFAYLTDFIVKDAYRDQAIGSKLTSHILQHPKLSDVYQWLLITSTAHSFYAKHGFKPLEAPDKFMQITNKRPNSVTAGIEQTHHL